MYLEMSRRRVYTRVSCLVLHRLLIDSYRCTPLKVPRVWTPDRSANNSFVNRESRFTNELFASDVSDALLSSSAIGQYDSSLRRRTEIETVVFLLRKSHTLVLAAYFSCYF